MTGIPEFNFPAFNAKADELRAVGLRVINPAEHDMPEDTPWGVYLRKDIRILMDCDSIYMLPGWSKSKGARLEHHIACELSMAVIYGAPE